MKFGKHFKRQKVPEWTDAYMDYNSLKSILGEIARHKQMDDQNQPSVSSRVLRSFSGLTVPPSNVRGKADVEDQDQAIDVGLSGSRHKYKTRFLREFEEGGDVEAAFFQKLDDELNKVNVFYKDKVEEVLQEADLINKQMDALVALRIRVQNPDLDVSEMKPHPSESNGFKQTTNSKVEAKIPKDSKSKQSDDSWEEESVGCPKHITSPDRDTQDKGNKCEEHPLEILDHVRINNTLESPASTLKEIFGESNDFKLRFKKDELKEVEDRLRRVFIEFYQKLRHLRHYSFINLSAFAKILKKYEKVTSRRVSRSYMKIVENSHIGNSDEVSVLLDRVEGVFIKHFCRSNRSEAMKSLRPKLKREKHRVTFFSGFFAGCSFALVAAIVLRIESRNLMEKQEGYLYMANVFPLYSFFGFIILHMLIYAADIYFWRRYKVNYSFIFGFKQGTDLGYWEVFLLSSGLAVLSLASFMVNLYLDLGTRPHHYKTFTQLVPLGLVLIVLGITFCPFDILFRPSRFFFVRCLFRCICAPLYQVKQPDFFLADSLTSQVQALRCLELYVCYYGLGEYSQRQNRCHSHNGYNVFYFIVAVIPYWIRFLQCMRRLWEDKDPVHGYNGFKYFLTIFAVVFRTASELKKGTVWFVLGLISSGLAIVMNTYWDIAIDWGLLRRHSKNFLLRDKLVVSQKSVYYAAIILNVVLRIVWMQQVVEFKLPALHKMAAATSIACLEIIRRGIWSFFRLENEHLNNVGHYRAFKSIPHPFTYDDDDEEGEDGGDKDD